MVRTSPGVEHKRVLLYVVVACGAILAALLAVLLSKTPTSPTALVRLNWTAGLEHAPKVYEKNTPTAIYGLPNLQTLLDLVAEGRIATEVAAAAVTELFPFPPATTCLPPPLGVQHNNLSLYVHGPDGAMLDPATMLGIPANICAIVLGWPGLPVPNTAAAMGSGSEYCKDTYEYLGYFCKLGTVAANTCWTWDDLTPFLVNCSLLSPCQFISINMTASEVESLTYQSNITDTPPVRIETNHTLPTRNLTFTLAPDPDGESTSLGWDVTFDVYFDLAQDDPWLTDASVLLSSIGIYLAEYPIRVRGWYGFQHHNRRQLQLSVPGDVNITAAQEYVFAFSSLYGGSMARVENAAARLCTKVCPCEYPLASFIIPPPPPPPPPLVPYTTEAELVPYLDKSTINTTALTAAGKTLFKQKLQPFDITAGHQVEIIGTVSGAASHVPQETIPIGDLQKLEYASTLYATEAAVVFLGTFPSNLTGGADTYGIVVHLNLSCVTDRFYVLSVAGQAIEGGPIEFPPQYHGAVAFITHLPVWEFPYLHIASEAQSCVLGNSSADIIYDSVYLGNFSTSFTLSNDSYPGEVVTASANLTDVNVFYETTMTPGSTDTADLDAGEEIGYVSTNHGMSRLGVICIKNPANVDLVTPSILCPGFTKSVSVGSCFACSSAGVSEESILGDGNTFYRAREVAVNPLVSSLGYINPTTSYIDAGFIATVFPCVGSACIEAVNSTYDLCGSWFAPSFSDYDANSADANFGNIFYMPLLEDFVLQPGKDTVYVLNYLNFIVSARIYPPQTLTAADYVDFPAKCTHLTVKLSSAGYAAVQHLGATLYSVPRAQLPLNTNYNGSRIGAGTDTKFNSSAGYEIGRVDPYTNGDTIINYMAGDGIGLELTTTPVNIGTSSANLNGMFTRTPQLSIPLYFKIVKDRNTFYSSASVQNGVASYPNGDGFNQPIYGKFITVIDGNLLFALSAK